MYPICNTISLYTLNIKKAKGITSTQRRKAKIGIGSYWEAIGHGQNIFRANLVNCDDLGGIIIKLLGTTRELQSAGCCIALKREFYFYFFDVVCLICCLI